MFDFNTTFETMMQSNNLDTVVLLAHMNPDGDAAGCVMGLAHYVHTVYPQYTVIPHLADTLDKGPKKLVAEDMIFNPYEKPSAEKYGVIVCDTATRERMIGYDLFENSVASIVIDHHASNEGYGDINVVKISEACSENLFYMLNWNMWKTSKVKNKNVENHPNAADYIYMGILHDTGCFSRAMESTLTAVNGKYFPAFFGI